MKTKIKPLEFELNCTNNHAEFAYEAANVQPFETILDTFDYKDITEIKWGSKYNHYVEYNHEPYCIDGFMKHRQLEFKSEEHIKFFLYLLNNYIDNIKQLQTNYNTNSDNSNTTEEVNSYNEIS
jgi:hypothetical protein